jgi:hypothetical protein
MRMGRIGISAGIFRRLLKPRLIARPLPNPGEWMKKTKPAQPLLAVPVQANWCAVL